MTRLSPADSPVFALQRVSADGRDAVLVLINTDVEKPNAISFSRDALESVPEFSFDNTLDLLDQPAPKNKQSNDGKTTFTLNPGACYCLAPATQTRQSSGNAYRRARAQAAWAIGALGEILDPEEIGSHDWRALAGRVERDPKSFLASIARLDKKPDLLAALDQAAAQKKFPQVVTWSLIDRRRVTLAPPKHWLLVQDTVPFCVTLRFGLGETAWHARSIAVQDAQFACFPPRAKAGDAELVAERYGITEQRVMGAIRFLHAEVGGVGGAIRTIQEGPDSKPQTHTPRPSDLVLLTNGIGGMARMCVDLGRITSKYDCLLGANLNPRVPVDRHIFAKRIRVWANANGFISALNADNLAAFEPGPPACWQFAPNAGDGRVSEIEMVAEMPQGQNTTVVRFRRGRDSGCPVPDSKSEGRESEETVERALARVRLVVRVDIEDRNFHWETKRNGAADHHFSANTGLLPDRQGFLFAPAPDRQLRVSAGAGVFHSEPEWCENIPHPVEASRGQVASGDAYSPGWFDLPLGEAETVTLVVTAEKEISIPPPTPPLEGRGTSIAARPRSGAVEGRGVGSTDKAAQPDSFLLRLSKAAEAFVVRRGDGKTVIAGYPWFLDWGRDTLICARGLLAAGMVEEVKQILVTFARFEENGTLPNTIHGDNASNRDTSDAPLWFGMVCEEMAEIVRGQSAAAPRPATKIRGAVEGVASGQNFYSTVVNERGRTIGEVLRSIAAHYRDGTPNRIRMDAASGLIWSPSHFTWMDTNFPAGTPREGYPIEIQVLWIRLLRQLERIGGDAGGESWAALANRAEASLQQYFWLENRGYFGDLLIGGPGKPASGAVVDTALRSNYLFAVSLGLVSGERAQKSVEAALQYLVVPGALRSLAPLTVSPPLPIHDPTGRLLNNPVEPYFGRYEGDEDRRRKPAYHNGTAWTWTFPVFCEALARAWDFSQEAVAAAKAYLGSMERLLDEGCLGQIPEILDGDAPHWQRGCDAQAWGVTEALRVWSILKERA